MNSVTNNSIYSYNHDSTNNAINSVQSTKNNTPSSNIDTESTSSSTDTLTISTSQNSIFFKTVNEVSSEFGTFQAKNCTVSHSEAFFTTKEMMKDAGYSVPSIDSSCSSYSNFLDEMKDFLSNNSDISYSNQLINFCDNLQDRLSTYGIN